jgi:hypothetical protein
MTGGEAAAAATPTSHRVRSRLRPGLDRVLVWGGILLLSVLIVGLHDKAHPELSQIDELQHVDYLYRVADFHLVHTGQHVQQQAMEAEACRGGDQPGVTFPPCHSKLTPAEFPGDGYSTADIHPPTYYAITALVGSAIKAVGVTSSLVTAARLVGGLWLGLGLILLFEASLLLGATRLAALTIVAFIVSTPQIVYLSAIVNPDVTGLAAGGLVLIATVQWERGRWPTWGLCLACAAAAGTKSTWLLAVMAAMVYLVLRAFASRRRGATDLDPPVYPFGAQVVVAVVAGGIALATQGVWLAYRHATALRGVTIPETVWYHVKSLSVHDVTSQLSSMVLPIDKSFSPILLPHLDVQLALQALDILIFVGSLSWFVLVRRSNALALWGVSAYVGLVVGAVFLVVSSYVTTHDFIPLPSRYGLGVLPLLAAVTATALRNRAALSIAALVGLASLAATLQALVSAAHF